MKIYVGNDSDFEIVGQRVSPLIKPLLEGKQSWSQEGDLSWGKRFDSYFKLSHQLFSLSTLEDSDVAILPMDWSFIRGHSWSSKTNQTLENWALDFEQQVQSSKKKLAVFFIGDRSHEKIALKDAVVFRSGLYESRRKTTDFAMPAFPEDLLEHFCSGTLTTRSKQEKPTVGFCGLAKPRNSPKDKAIVLAYKTNSLIHQGWLDISPHKGENLRKKALKILEVHPSIQTNFKVRSQSVFLNNPSASAEDKKKVRQEYVSNLRDSDYTLCCRGSGNFSIRLYETLCMGRIPIFINTDCVLPYDFKLRWKDYCVWIEEKDLNSLGDKVKEFHDSLSNQEFVELQKECRKLWKEWLSPEGFIRNLHLHF